MSAPNLEKYRKFIDSRIRRAVGDGKLKVEIHEDPYNMWLYDEQKLPEKDMDGFRVVKELRELGYKVSHYYNSSSYFADVALVISWDKQ